LNVRCSKPSGPSETAAVIIRVRHLEQRGRWIGKSSGSGFFQLAISAKVAPIFYIGLSGRQPQVPQNFVTGRGPALDRYPISERREKAPPLAGRQGLPRCGRPGEHRPHLQTASEQTTFRNMEAQKAAGRPEPGSRGDLCAELLSWVAEPRYCSWAALWRRPQKSKVPCLKSSTSARSG
jgi:hypothetical protein